MNSHDLSRHLALVMTARMARFAYLFNQSRRKHTVSHTRLHEVAMANMVLELDHEEGCSCVFFKI